MDKVTLSIDEVLKVLQSNEKLNQVKDVSTILNKRIRQQSHSYIFALCKKINEVKLLEPNQNTPKEEEKKYVFIIDEINRGEISKILGELFFTIDPGYRGKNGEISTQYSNLHRNPDEKFYIPENVYIIGTMNDIDRSVDNFDFAMRRRFRFIEIKPDDTKNMLDQLGDKKDEAINRMDSLNKVIVDTDGLNENYQIGAGGC